MSGRHVITVHQHDGFLQQKARSRRRFRAVAIGLSTGGVDALQHLLPALPGDFPLPILIVIHLAAQADDGLARMLDGLSALRVKEADHDEQMQPGVAYLAPANYHLLVEKNDRLALSTDPPVHFARPSIDVLFESAAANYGDALIGIILSGAAEDGAAGLACIKRLGGYTIIQDPADAMMASMPEHALLQQQPDRLLALNELAALLLQLSQRATLQIVPPDLEDLC